MTRCGAPEMSPGWDFLLCTLEPNHAGQDHIDEGTGWTWSDTTTPRKL